MLAPIPGMSLTKEPRNQTWEQPPMYNTKEEALAFYFKKLSTPDTLEDMIFLLKRKFPVEAFVNSLTSYGVMEGYHTVDVKTLISPILHEHIVLLAKALKIKVVEWQGPSDEEKRSKKEKERITLLVQEALDGDVEDEENEGSVSEEEMAAAAETLTMDKPSLIKRRA